MPSINTDAEFDENIFASGDSGISGLATIRVNSMLDKINVSGQLQAIAFQLTPAELSHILC